MSSCPLELTHFDHSYSSILSRHGFDLMFNLLMIIPIQQKFDSSSSFIKFKLFIENLFSSKIKQFQYDNSYQTN